MFDNLKSRFIDDAHHWYKMWSSWLAIGWGFIVTIFWTDPTVLPQALNSLPPEVRVYVSPLVFGFASAVPIVVRLLKQRKTPA